MARHVLIEYTQDTESYSESRHEAVPIEAGTRRLVDPASADGLVKKGVAKKVTDDDKSAEVDEDDEDDAPAQPTGITTTPFGGGS